MVDVIDDSIYNCSFSPDGQKFFISSHRGMMVYSYDDQKSEDAKVFTKEADINGYNISWTITDADLSDNKRFIIHSTLNPLLHCFDLEKMKYVSHFNLAPSAMESDYFHHNSAPVFSIKISGDNNELIAGCGKSSSGMNLKVFNIERNKVTQSIKAHALDINSITYLDRNSSALLLSASDDGFGKVWDMRALGMNQHCQGYLIGHHAGLTSITSRGDHVYCATNSKDQSLKLWDLRKLEGNPDNKPIDFRFYDYRYQMLSRSLLESFKKPDPTKHFDNSIETFYDHFVLKTLIRCHFSPESLNDGRYIYSGSACGKVFVWDIFTRKKVAEYHPRKNDEIVRDCAWHPFKPLIVMTNLGGFIYKLEMDTGMDAVKLKFEGKNKVEEQVSSENEENYIEYDGEEDESDYT